MKTATAFLVIKKNKTYVETVYVSNEMRDYFIEQAEKYECTILGEYKVNVK